MMIDLLADLISMCVVLIQGYLTVLPWNLPIGFEVWAQAMTAALNDCLYRNMPHYKYLVIVDTDEFLVPYIHTSLNTLILTLENHPSLTSFNQQKNMSLSHGAFIFQNIFFPLNGVVKGASVSTRINKTSMPGLIVADHTLSLTHPTNVPRKQGHNAFAH